MDLPAWIQSFKRVPTPSDTRCLPTYSCVLLAVVIDTVESEAGRQSHPPLFLIGVDFDEVRLFNPSTMNYYKNVRKHQNIEFLNPNVVSF